MTQAQAQPAKPVVMEIQYPDKVSRALNFLIFIKNILAIPHVVILILYCIAYAVMSIIAWVAILITGRYPRGLFDFAVKLLRWQLRVTAYLMMLRDEYPPFNGNP
ncbi:MAG: DUF4389 domain-containing protein [Dehalococcoidia bacterium]|nr:DUF4389 domain-containing protein [Dehalococcoidia bacterium]